MTVSELKKGFVSIERVKKGGQKIVYAENQIAEFKKRGISGQNRDFAPAIEANRVAMCANDEDYGLKLQFDWRR